MRQLEEFMEYKPNEKNDAIINSDKKLKKLYKLCVIISLKES